MSTYATIAWRVDSAIASEGKPVNLIFISHWSPKTQFVDTCQNSIWRKPDPWFQRYTAGKEPPRYPVPALYDSLLSGTNRGSIVCYFQFLCNNS